MRIEEQLRNLAREIEDTQVPVSLGEIVPDAFTLGGSTVDRADRPRSAWLAMVAATVVVLAGLGAVLWWAGDDTDPVVPVDSGVSGGGTEPSSSITTPSSTVPTTTADNRPSPDPEVPQPLPLPFIDEPTNLYREDAVWWMPTEVAAGYEFLWAEEYQDGERELYYVSADAPTDRDFSPRGGRSDVINIWVLPEAAAVNDWLLALEGGTQDQVTINGEAWLRSSTAFPAELSRVIDGELVTVGARSDEVALDVAERLEQLPETEFARAPYRSENRVVVASLPAELGDGETPIEFTAASDGLTVVVDGQGPFFPTDEPVRFGAMETSPPDQGGLTTLSAVTSPEVATVEFEQPNGDIITIEPTDLSGRFTMGFIFVKIGTPLSGETDSSGDGMTISRSMPSVVARDADGNVVAEITPEF